MKTLIFIFSLLVSACTIQPSKNRQIFISATGWRFEIPDKFHFNDSSFNIQGQLTAVIPGNGSSLRLFVSKSNKGSFAAYLWKDTFDLEGWKDYHDKDTEWYFTEMRQLPQMTVLDTRYSKVKVGNVDFLVQYIKYIRKSTNDTGYTYHYFGKMSDKGLEISFDYLDKQLGRTFHDIVSSSTFSN